LVQKSVTTITNLVGRPFSFDARKPRTDWQVENAK
jgi:hypothetical protein